MRFRYHNNNAFAWFSNNKDLLFPQSTMAFLQTSPEEIGFRCFACLFCLSENCRRNLQTELPWGAVKHDFVKFTMKFGVRGDRFTLVCFDFLLPKLQKFLSLRGIAKQSRIRQTFAGSSNHRPTMRNSAKLNYQLSWQPLLLLSY